MSIIFGTDLAQYLRISETEEDDQALDMAAETASDWVRHYCGRSFETQTVASARTFRPESTSLAYVDDFYSTTDLVIGADYALDGSFSTAWTLNTDYLLEPYGSTRYGVAWPYYKLTPTSSSMWAFPDLCSYQGALLSVTAKWGWAEVPSAVMSACLIQAARIYRRRNSPEGVLGGFQDFGPVRVTNRVDPDVADLLAPYRRGDVLVGIG